jgi:putative transposase
MIDRCRDAYSVRMMCRHLNVSASGYYEWRNREPSRRDVANRALLTRIKELHNDSDGVMGAPRICEELHYQGIPCGENRVARLMRIHELQGILQKRQWKKKDTTQRPAGITNHLQRNFHADEQNTKWVTDITYIRTAEGWLYLCVVVDLRRRLVHEPSLDSGYCHSGRTNGRVAKGRSITGYLALRSWMSVHQ